MNEQELMSLSTSGMKERFDISRYDDALRANLRRLAEKIIEDWRCETDDSAILIFRNNVK